MAGRASGLKLFFQNICCVMMINPSWIGRGLGYQRLPRGLYGRAPVESMLMLFLVKTRGEREKSNQEAAGTMEGETHTHKGWVP